MRIESPALSGQALPLPTFWPLTKVPLADLSTICQPPCAPSITACSRDTPAEASGRIQELPSRRPIVARPPASVSADGARSVGGDDTTRSVRDEAIRWLSGRGRCWLPYIAARLGLRHIKLTRRTVAARRLIWTARCRLGRC